jgi:LuxR family transcriptional regulator, quorum-sensing system regulator BjaR1
MMGEAVLGRTLDQLVFDTVERAHLIETAHELGELFDPACKRLGCNHIGAFSVKAPDGHMVGGYQAGSTDPAWADHYVKARHFERDGVVALLPLTLDVMVWSDLLENETFADESKEVFREARSFGLADGFVLPQHYLNGAVGATILTSSDAITKSPRERAALQILASFYGSVVRRIMAPQTINACVKLTPRQRECLQWVRAGKTDWEIGKILNLSEHTVADHIDAARKRLGVKNRTQAVIEAIARRLIHI